MDPVDIFPVLTIPFRDDRVFAFPAPRLDAKRQADHFRRCVDDAQTQRLIGKRDITWNKVVKTLKRDPNSALKNTSIRHFYKVEGHMFLVKFGFTFGLCFVEPGTQHVYQLSSVPLLCFHLPTTHHDRKTFATLTRRIFLASDQKYYISSTFHPHQKYVVPSGTKYLILATQKTIFSVQVIPDTIQLSPSEFFSFTTHKEQTHVYNIPPPTPRHPGSGSVSSCRSNDAPKQKHDWKKYIIPKRTTKAPNVSRNYPPTIGCSDSQTLTTRTNEFDIKANGPPENTLTLRSELNSMLMEIQSWAETQPTLMDLESTTTVLTQTIEPQTKNLSSSQECLDFEEEMAFLDQPYCWPSHTPTDPIVHTSQVTSTTEPNLETLNTKPSWPFKTLYVNCPWSMKHQELVPPSLLSQKPDRDIGPAHGEEVSHRDHLTHVLGNTYRIGESNGTEHPLDLMTQ
ncbi:hypothetical protein JTE90_017160 [Oedothorax gibbosus]|uniref:Uncharacterized protein n=1 Tax=Oedothorax gibbosus TaxID=931172 RepID=A0AAV6TLA6_9ARAC|nr:hypothetical protein JTE90_017160 [Oedothorax gibbosus]